MDDRRHPHLRGGVFAGQRDLDVVEHVSGAIAAARNHPPVRPAVVDAPVRVAMNREAALVQQRVVMRAEQREVVESRGAAVGPVVDMVHVDVAHVPAAGERAAAVTRPKRAPERRRDRPLFTADVERSPSLVLEDCDQAPVATEALDGFDWQVGATNPSAEG
jgi:hypothetical protein